MTTGHYLGTALHQWPGRPVEVPPVLLPELVDVREDVLVFSWDSARVTRLPLEACLREVRQLDPFSHAAVTDFARQYGPLADPRWALLPGEPSRTWQPACLSTRTLQIATGTPSYREQRLVQTIREQAQAARVAAAASGHEPAAGEVELLTVDELSLHLTILRDMARLTQSLLPAADAAALLTFADVVKDWENPLISPPKFEGLAPVVLEEMLNPGLAPFHVRIYSEAHEWPVQEGDGQDGVAEWDDLAGRRESLPSDAVRAGAVLFSYPRTVNPRTYAALCLQLSNLIAEGLPLRKCAAEDCQNLFVRKRDERYQKGRHRLRGVRFCSARCEDRQKKRDSRRRQAERKSEEP